MNPKRKVIDGRQCFRMGLTTMSRRSLLVVLALVTQCSGRRLSAAAIFPGIGPLFGKKAENETPSERPPPRRPPSSNMYPNREGRPVDQVGRAIPGYSPQPRPLVTEIQPPPPPPPKSEDGGTTYKSVSPESMRESMPKEGSMEETALGGKLLSDEGGGSMIESSHPPLWGPHSYGGQGPFGTTIPPPPPPGWSSSAGGEMWQPPAYSSGWAIPEQQYYHADRAEVDGQFDVGYLQQQLHDSIAREDGFLFQIQNLTATLSAMEQREELHTRQLDVLTERVIETEAELSTERNAATEYNANCTELGRSLAVMQDELEEWKSRCMDLTEQHQRDENVMEELKDIVKERSEEVEQLAMSIENNRLNRERDRYLSERGTKKRRGLFAWLFGLAKDDSDDDEERLQELAKSTLLRALQSERSNVEELETALSTLQQNNSAISEMVESRDMLIDELNGRVAVFEEDKVVLKAALRQLQKEMKEEAPKTQKLAKDLKHAKHEIDRLNTEIHSLIATHQDELGYLQATISQKQSAINATESNLTMIGTYVDKLEERLASFAIARREIELREQSCKDIEVRAAQAEHDRDEMNVKAAEYAKEHDELKSLLEELVQERGALREENDALTREKNELINGESRLKGTIDSLEQESAVLADVLGEWKSKVQDLESDLEEEREKNREAQIKLDELAAARQDDEVSDDTDYTDALSEFSSEMKGEMRAPQVEPPSLPVEASASTTGEERSIVGTHGQAKDLTHLPGEIAALNVMTSLSVLPSGTGSTAMVDGSVQLAQQQQQLQRSVPFRSIRKTFSRYTGIHGLITPPSRPGLPRRVPPGLQRFVPPQTRGPSVNAER